MSRQLDVSKFKDVFIDAIHVGEMWFRGVLVYVKKKPPQVTLTLSAADDKITMTAQFVDYEHKYRYAEERKYSSSIKYTHGIAYRQNSYGSILGITQTGVKKVNFQAYSDDGKFSYSLTSSQYGSKTRKHYFRAWIAYIDPETGKNRTAFSNQISASYNSLL